MKTKTNFFRIAMVALMIATMSMSAFAQRGNGNGRGHGNGMGNNGNPDGFAPRHEMMAKMLNLTQDQQDKMDKLHTAHMKEMLGFRNQIGEKRAKLHTLRTADKANMSEIEKVVKEMGEVKTNMSLAREKHLQDVRALLNEDQRVLFDTHRPKQGERGGKGNGHRNGGCR